jgi:monothiol glutaredoxin
MSAHDRIRRLIGEHEVVLFMKGTRGAPQCGFSARVVDILDEYLEDYATVDVLADASLREGIKAFSNWPTIPQLYVQQRFVGGSDIVHELVKSGELAGVLGAERMELAMPEVHLTPAARGAFMRFWETDGETEEPVVRLTIGSDWEALLDLDEERDGDVVVELGGLAIVMTRSSAKRAHGVVIDFVERGGQAGFRVENPGRPPSVQTLSPKELETWRKRSKPHLLLDARTPEERAVARIAPSELLDDAMRARLEELDREKTIVCYCHHGMRSRRAAEHLVRMGFRDVHNLEGGIDAWSTEVDATVPRY